MASLNIMQLRFFLEKKFLMTRNKLVRRTVVSQASM